MAGLVPGLMIGFGLMTYCYFFGRSVLRDRARRSEDRPRRRDAALPLMIPVILLGGILTGWFTPTEAGVVAALWIIVVIIPALNRRHIMEPALRFLPGRTDFLAAPDHDRRGQCLRLDAGLSARRDRHRGVDHGIAGNDPHLIMLLLVLLFTIVGDFIEPVPTIIIFMPLVNALTTGRQHQPVHMGVVLIATLAFGLITPPYGLVLLMASKFVGVRFSQGVAGGACRSTSFSLQPSRSCIYFPRSCCGCPSRCCRLRSAASKIQTGQG